MHPIFSYKRDDKDKTEFEDLPNYSTSSALSPTVATPGTLESYQAEQDRLADELHVMTQGLKSLSRHAQNVIKTDISRLQKANNLTDRNTAKLSSTNTKLKQYNRQWQCTCHICLVLSVFAAFTCLVLIMKIIPKSI